MHACVNLADVLCDENLVSPYSCNVIVFQAKLSCYIQNAATGRGRKTYGEFFSKQCSFLLVAPFVFLFCYCFPSRTFPLHTKCGHWPRLPNLWRIFFFKSNARFCLLHPLFTFFVTVLQAELFRYTQNAATG